MALSLAHFIIIACGGFWTSKACSKLGDFLALEMRSAAVQSAALLAGVDGGVVGLKTRGLVVWMRENEEKPGELEMVLEEKHDTLKPDSP